MTKIYCDIADKKLIKKYNTIKSVCGFTTNPSLIRKAGAKNYSVYCKDLLKITSKPISFEVFGDDEDSMIKQGEEIDSWGRNIYVKIPICNSNGMLMNKVIKKLNNDNIKLNITAVYSHKQTKEILKNINKKTKVIISIFAGRMADAGIDPIPEFKKSLKLSKNFKNVRILWASTREPYNYIQAKQLKCHIITVPPNIIDKIRNFGKTQKKLTVDTVKTFLKDANASNFQI